MAKFNVGDKVKVKLGIAAGEEYMSAGDKRIDGCLVISEMADKAGTVVTIAEVLELGTYTRYHIAEDHWFWADGMFEGLADNHKIVITHDGKTTTARLFNGKELIKKAEAKCSPDDKFDFMVGAKLAMERLEGDKPAKKFTPHLECGGEHFGNIGDKTNYKDAIGCELRIGDVIELYDAKSKKYFGNEAIVRDREKAFVMGCKIDSDEKTGKTKGWKIIKKRSFEDVKNGEEVGAVRYVKEE